MKISRALISLSDKRNLDFLIKTLSDYNIDILSTGNTGKNIEQAGYKVTYIKDYTNFPEILSGRVKTLHPNIFGSILARRDNKSDINTLSELSLIPIDLVVVNFYPFEEKIHDLIDKNDLLKYIDIGGPSMVRAAAKNYPDVTTITSIEQYTALAEELEKNNGETSLEFRNKCAVKAFQLTSHYDSIIARTLHTSSFPETLNISANRDIPLFYGENPHQKAYYYKDPLQKTDLPSLSKNLSFNNILDAEIAVKSVKTFPEPTVSVIKHQTLCGLACDNSLANAFSNAYETDPMSAFGSIIALNREIDEQTAELIHKKGLIVMIIAPGAKENAKTILKKKKKRKIILNSDLFLLSQTLNIKSITGGFLLQENDSFESVDHWEIVTKNKPTEDEIASLKFAQRSLMFIKSNSVVLAKNKMLVGIGGGCVSRVDAVIQACRKAGDRSKEAVLASDAFFPFPDALEYAFNNGIRIFSQPGGSKKDNEIIEYADKAGISMIFTHRRHFYH